MTIYYVVVIKFKRASQQTSQWPLLQVSTNQNPAFGESANEKTASEACQWEVGQQTSNSRVRLEYRGEQRRPGPEQSARCHVTQDTDSEYLDPELR